jgi:large subunit ribosomal protein L9
MTSTSPEPAKKKRSKIMDVILTEDVSNLGEMGEIVSVAPGYGRNFLIPRGMAIPATNANKAQVAHHLAEIDKRKADERAAAQGMLKALQGVSVTVPKRAGDEERLYGSVTNREIADLLAAQGHTVDKKQVVLEQPINELGIYLVPIKLASGIYANIKVWVVSV